MSPPAAERLHDSWSDPLVEAQRAFRQGSRSFSAAAWLFDAATRRDVTLLYSWCRHCDDVVDGQVLGHGVFAAGSSAVERLAVLEAQTRLAFGGGNVTDPAFRCLADLAQRRGLREEWVIAHLAGFRMDVEGRHYAEIEETLDYCHHVAGVVGLMMAQLMGVSDPAVLARAADLGVAFQLTNIARDVMEDAANGRVYLPQSWLTEAGVAAGGIGAPDALQAVTRVVARLLALADRYYASAEIGLAALPFRCRWAIATASAVYRDIGTQILALGEAAWARRVHTGRGRKLLLAAISLWRVSRRVPRAFSPAIEPPLRA